MVMVTMLASSTSFFRHPVRSTELGTSGKEGGLLSHQVLDARRSYNEFESSSSSTPPHIIFIYIDDMGYADMGYNNNEIAFATKYMDKLANNGIKLTWYYGQPSCTPSRAALLTGYYPINTGMQFKNVASDSPFGVPLEFDLLGHYMKRAGYSAHFLGKWNIGHYTPDYLPSSRGFDSFLCYFSVMEDYYNYFDTQRIDSRHWRDLLQSNTSLASGGWSQAAADDIGEYSTALYVKKGKSIIKRYADKASDSLFLLLAFQAVHGPQDVPPTKSFTSSEVKKIAKIRQTHGNDRAKFAEILLYLDYGIEKIVQQLERSQMLSETLVVVASDNGGCPDENGGFNYPLRGQKGSVWEGGVRVPGFVYSSSNGIIPSNTRGTSYAKLFHCTDWLPTLLRAANSASLIPSGIDGVDQWRELIGEKEGVPRSWLIHNINIYDSDTSGLTSLGYTYAALRYGDWKLILNEQNESIYRLNDYSSAPSCEGTSGGNVSALFNISADPQETTDLWDLYPDVVSKLKRKIDRLKDDMYESVYKSSDVDAVRVWEDYDRFVTPWVNLTSR